MRRRLSLAAAAVLALVAAVALATSGDDDGDERPAGEARTQQPDRTERESEDGRGRTGRGRERSEDAERIGNGTVPGPHGRLTVGLADQKPAMFTDERFLALGIEHVRLVAPWDAGLRGHRATDRWLSAARAGGFTPLVVFGHADGAQCPADPCEAPTAREFERAFAGFRRRWPHVTTFSTWNEPNHASQPVARDPALVARYWRTIRERCRGCTVLAADVVADRTARRWVPAFVRAADRRPRRWGVHNYPDTNRFTSANTEAFLGLVDGEVWITETGGIVEFTTADGRTPFPYDERRAARATRQMFEVARSNPRIRRLYVYHWNQVNPPGRFDAGVIGPDGRARPAYRVLRDELSR